MNLQNEYQQLRTNVREQTPTDVLQQQEQLVTDLQESGMSTKAITVGDRAPDFALKDATGKRITLRALLHKGPVVLNFYRGGWCPFCNLELNALQRHIPAFNALEAQLVAISPESPDNSLTTVQKHQLTFAVLSDLDSQVARQYGITYTVPEYLKPVFERFGLDLKAHNAAEILRLPIPATYIIDRKQIIRFAYVNENFTVRADIVEMLKVLEKLKNNTLN